MNHADIKKKTGQNSANLLRNLSIKSVDLVTKSSIKKYKIECSFKPNILHVAPKLSFF